MEDTMMMLNSFESHEIDCDVCSAGRLCATGVRLFLDEERGDRDAADAADAFDALEYDAFEAAE